MRGFIKLPRDFLEWEWWNVYPHHQLFEWLLIQAKVADCRVRGIMVRRGSVLTTWEDMRKAVSNRQRQCSVGSLSRALRDLSDSGDITLRTERKNTLITVCKFDTYNGGNNSIWSDSGVIVERSRSDTPIIKENKEYEENNIYSASGFSDDDGLVTDADCRTWMQMYNGIARTFGVADKDLAQQLNDTRRRVISQCVRLRGRGTVDAMFARLAESYYFFQDGSRGFRGDFTKLWSPKVFDMVLEGSFVPRAKTKEKPQQEGKKAAQVAATAELPARKSTDEYEREMREYAAAHPDSQAAKIVAQWDQREQIQTTK